MPFLHALRRGLELPAGDRSLFLRAYVDLGWTNLALRVLGFQRLLARIDRAVASTDDMVGRDELRRARRYARWVESAARRHVVRSYCLQRSLVLHGWLREEGLPSRLRIGVLRDGPGLKAHAWVELAGHVVNDPPTAVMAFTPLASASSRGVQWQ